MVVCRDQFGARDSWLNNWEHRGEDMYCPRALLKLPRSGRDFFFFALRTALLQPPVHRLVSALHRTCRIPSTRVVVRLISSGLPHFDMFALLFY